MTRSRKRRVNKLFDNRFNGSFRWRSVEEQAWLDIVPVGREFGSPDYYRYERLDGSAFAAFGDMAVAHEWLSQPHPALGGLSPNDCVSSDAELQKALNLLTNMINKKVV